MEYAYAAWKRWIIKDSAPFGSASVEGNGLDTFGPNAPFLPKRLFEQQDIISRLLNPFQAYSVERSHKPTFLKSPRR
jgi:hypothetical protein